MGFREEGEDSHILTTRKASQGGSHVACQMQWGPYGASVPSRPASLGHSLRVQLVQRAIHSHGDLQVLQPLVFPPLLHDSSQASAAELGRPPGHSSAHLLHHNAVLTCAVQAELLQDPPDLEEGQPITVGKQSRTSGPASWGPGTCSAWLTAPHP